MERGRLRRWKSCGKGVHIDEYIRPKSYGVHMETSRRCVTDRPRGTHCDGYMPAHQFVGIVFVPFARSSSFIGTELQLRGDMAASLADNCVIEFYWWRRWRQLIVRPFAVKFLWSLKYWNFSFGQGNFAVIRYSGISQKLFPFRSTESLTVRLFKF